MPRWTEQQLKDYENRNSRAPSRAVPEPAICHEPVAETPGKDCHPNRVTVRIKSCRRRLLDPDNCIPKYFIDGIVYAGLLHGDSPDKITLEVSQQKIGMKDDERTEITIETKPEAEI